MKQILQTNKALVTLVILLSVMAMPSYSESTRGLDPTKPLFGSQQAMVVKVGNNLALESVFHGGNTATVIINGKALKLNESIGEYRVTLITKDSVVLLSPEKELKLSLFTSVKK